MRPKRPTSFEVARIAGVSRSTVSVVLNGTEGVTIAEQTRERVLKAAESLGYVPSYAARQLASGRSRTIGVAISYSEYLKVDAYIPQALYAINEAAVARDYDVIVEYLGRTDAFETLAKGRQIDGLIVVGEKRRGSGLETLKGLGLPLVVIGPSSDQASVDVDNRVATTRAVEHLQQKGRKRLAYIAYAPTEDGSSRERVEGWRQAVEAAGGDASEAWFEVANFTAESGRLAALRILHRVQPDAIVCGNDMIAFGAMTALREQGMTIPDDVAVTGFDDIPLAAHAVPPLTTMRLPAEPMGREAATCLIDALEHDSEPAVSAQVVPASLIERESSG